MEVLNIITNYTNFDDLKTQLKELHLHVRKYDELGLFLVKYNKNTSDMENSDVQKCRGLVGEVATGNLVCLPPIKSIECDKFMDIVGTELNDVSIEEFIDGTMINLFYFGNEWHISTRSNIGANCRWYSQKHFSELFEESNTLDFDMLEKQMTYTFVLRHPENRIVTSYTEPSITLVAARKIVDGQVIDHDIFEIGEALKINVPTRYDMTTIDEIISFTERQDFQFQGIVLKNGLLRTKIRNPNYNYARNLRGNSQNLKFLYFDLRKNQFVQEYLRFFPEYTETFEEYNKEYTELLNMVFNNYQNFHVKKLVKSIKDMDYVTRPFCYELHGEYKKNKGGNNYFKITRQFVSNFMNELPPARIVYALNHQSPESPEST
jgi:hypothetical protein